MKNEAVHNLAMRNLQAELARLEKRFKAMEISVKKSKMRVDTTEGDASTIDDESKPEKSQHNISTTDSESASIYNEEVPSKKRKSSESYIDESAGQLSKKKIEQELLDSFNNLITRLLAEIW